MRWDVSFKNRDRSVALDVSIAALGKTWGMCRAQLAESAAVSRFDPGAIKAPLAVRNFSLKTLYPIADALGVKPGDLLSGVLSQGGQKAD